VASIFISHSSDDNAQALALTELLTKIGFDQVFLDFDKHKGIPLGSDWERRLYHELERCHAMLLVLTQNWLASKWCFAEFAQARALGKTIYVVLEKPQAEPGEIASDIQVCDLISNREIGLARLHEELKTALLVAQAGFAFEERLRPPFPGLAAFEELDAAVFFGRDPEISAVLETVKSERARSKKALALMGGSGTGKSSLLKAGVLPRLRRQRNVEGHPTHLVATMRPGEAPLRAACEALRAVDPALAPADLAAASQPDKARDFIDRLRLKANAPQAQLVLAIDQAEEIFSAPEAERAPFLNFLAALIAGDNPAQLLFSMRADNIEAAQKTALADALDFYAVKPMPLERLREIVRGPARRCDIAVEDELIEAIRADAATEDALPLVAFVLRELYERYGRKSRRLEKAHYEAMRLGDLTPLESAVRQRAEETIAGAPEAELMALRRAFTPGLVRLDEERGAFARRAARLEDLPQAARGLVARLVDARLLVTRAEADGAHVEVTHEALFRVWPKLAEWLKDDRELLAGLQGVRRAAAEWAEHGRAEAWLAHRGPRLEDPLKARELVGVDFGEAERAYLDACQARENAEAAEALARRRERENLQRQRLRAITIGLVAALALFFVAAGVSVVAWRQKLWADDRTEAALAAENQARLKSRQFAQQAAAQDLRQGNFAHAALTLQAIAKVDGSSGTITDKVATILAGLQPLPLTLQSQEGTAPFTWRGQLYILKPNNEPISLGEIPGKEWGDLGRFRFVMDSASNIYVYDPAKAAIVGSFKINDAATQGLVSICGYSAKDGQADLVGIRTPGGSAGSDYVVEYKVDSQGKVKLETLAGSIFSFDYDSCAFKNTDDSGKPKEFVDPKENAPAALSAKAKLKPIAELSFPAPLDENKLWSKKDLKRTGKSDIAQYFSDFDAIELHNKPVRDDDNDNNNLASDSDAKDFFDTLFQSLIAYEDNFESDAPYILDDFGKKFIFGLNHGIGNMSYDETLCVKTTGDKKIGCTDFLLFRNAAVDLNGIIFAPDGSTAVAFGNGIVVGPPEGDQFPSSPIYISHDTHFSTWQIPSHTESFGAIYGAAISPDSQKIALAIEDRIDIYNLADFSKTIAIVSALGAQDVAWLSDDELAIVTETGVVIGASIHAASPWTDLNLKAAVPFDVKKGESEQPRWWIANNPADHLALVGNGKSMIVIDTQLGAPVTQATNQPVAEVRNGQPTFEKIRIMQRPLVSRNKDGSLDLSWYDERFVRNGVSDQNAAQRTGYIGDVLATSIPKLMATK
jgi:hypothetical protein